MIRFVVGFLCLLISFNVEARWASVEEAVIKQDIYNLDITVDKDGAYKQTIESQFEILKEAGREEAAHYTVYYNADSEKVQILEAKAVYQGKEYKIDKKFIEDKPLASVGYGFDQTHQILLAFPKVEVGAKIYLKYSKATLKAPLDNFFDILLDFGYREWTTNANINIKSAIALHMLINDPEKALKITRDREDNFHNIEIILTKPLYKEVVNESKNSIFDEKMATYVSISSIKKWEDLSMLISKQNYNKFYKQDLPNTYLEIMQEALKGQSEIEQINIVTSRLNDKIQYMSDARSINGRFMPRDLEQTSKSQLGDCKDFSAATLAILNKMGYKVQFVLVMRGEGSFYPITLPELRAFNHVIVKVTGKDGKIYWIDPTNVQSMADGILPDIAGKPVLVLDNEQPIYEKTPQVDYSHAQFIHKLIIERIGDNKIIEKGNVTLKNEEAVPLIGIELYSSKESISDMVFSSLSGTNLSDNNERNITLPDLRSRIVKDLSIDYSYVQENKLFKTNLGEAFKLGYNKLGLSNYIHIPQDAVSDIYIGNPYSFKRQTIFKNIDVKNADALDVEINNKWLSLARKLSFKNGDLTIDETIIVKQSLIPNSDLKTPEFLNLKKELEQNYRDVSIVFN